MSDRLRRVGRAVCDRRGYDVSTPEKPWLPVALADPTPTTDPFVPRATSERVAVEPLSRAELTPTMLLSRLRNNRTNDRFSLFVVDQSTVETAFGILADPPLVAAEDEYGRRTFYNGPDRIRLADGGYAAVRTDSPSDALVWHEVGDGDDHSLVLVEGSHDADETAALPERTPESTGVLAWLDDVDSLACPPANSFPYSYRRDPADKRFRIRRRDGEVVGVYDGVSALRSNAYVPVPMPLVPEHVFAGVRSVRDEWAVLGVDESAAVDAETAVDTETRHRTPLDDSAIGLVTADSTRRR